MTVAYNGQANLLGAALFAVSLLALVAAFGITSAGILRQYLAARASRGWAIAAALHCPLAAVAFAAVAVTPENRVMAVHVDPTRLAWRLFAGAALLGTVASIRRDQSLRSRTAAWCILAGALMLYVVYLNVGSDVTSSNGLRAQVLAQKGITVIAVTMLLWLGAYRPAANEVPVTAVTA